MRLGFAGLLCVGLLLNGCGRSEGDLPPPEADKLPPPKPVVVSAPAEDAAEVAKHSGGLGLSPEAFNIRYGGRMVDCSEIPTDPYFCLGKGIEYGLSFPAKGNIQELTFNVTRGETVSPIRQQLQVYLPADARLLETYSFEFDGEPGLDLDNRLNSVVDIYQSDWLATRFKADQWMKVGVPGRFYINYRTPPVMEIGNGPSRSGAMRSRY